MREIKFRAWHKEKKCWLDEVEVYGDGSWRGGIRTNDALEMGYTYDECILVQYTGLHDSYGNEEYFSDIIEDEDGIRRIIEDGCSAVWFTNTQESKDVKYFWEITKPHKVIGNIYENPELLEV